MMTSISTQLQLRRRQLQIETSSAERSPQNDLVRRRGGLISVPRTLTSPRENNGGSASVTHQRLTKLLLNVNIERSLGPVHVVTSPENTVNDLIKAAIEIYVKEKRRPLLKETDPKCFQLHYSQFSLESLKAEKKLINLASRNFFLCSKPSSTSVNSFWSDQATTMTINSLFPFTKFMDFLL